MVHLVIVRELIGGIYFGDKCESEIHEGQNGFHLENYSVPEVDRRLAGGDCSSAPWQGHFCG